jgi:hypothetical protein
VWCAATFEDEADLQLNCPGLTAAEHDLDE